MKTYTDDEIKEMINEINNLTQIECARLRRFAPIGHPYFQYNLPLNSHFNARFTQLGGMTPEISKLIGWD